jgi:hypothetical protein
MAPEPERPKGAIGDHELIVTTAQDVGSLDISKVSPNAGMARSAFHWPGADSTSRTPWWAASASVNALSHSSKSDINR